MKLALKFTFTALALSVAWCGCVGPQSAARRVMVRSGSSAHIDVHARPGSRTAMEANQVAARGEDDLSRMTTVFAVANDRRYDLFIFDDFEDFRAVTGATPPIAGFALPAAAFFVLNDPALAHELAHAVAADKIGKPANEFLQEGLACIVFGPAKMASFDAEVRYLLKQKKLPALATLHAVDDFVKWSGKNPGIDLYRIGGSWLSFLFRTQGAANAKVYYRTGNTERAFAKKLETLETEWHAWLASHPMRAEAAAALERKFSSSGTTTTIADETFIFHVAVPTELQGYSYHWEKDGKPLVAQKGTSLLFLPIQTSDTGTYQLIATHSAEKRVKFELRIEVIDPIIFLPIE